MSKLLNTTWDALWKWRYSFLPRPACVTVHCDRQKGVGEDDGADDDGGVEEEWRRRRRRCGKLCEETISRWQSVANILQMPPASILQSGQITHTHTLYLRHQWRSSQPDIDDLAFIVFTKVAQGSPWWRHDCPRKCTSVWWLGDL